MTDVSYTVVCKEEAIRETSWKPFLRQLLVVSGAWSIHFLTGLSFGAPTVYVPQLRRASNDSGAVSDDMASWLSSSFGYSAIPWVFILPALSRYFGRKIPYLLVSIHTIVNYVIFYFSTTVYHLLTTSILFGICHASNMTLSILILTEYTSTRYRGLFLTIKTATIFWGIWASNAIGTFLNWRCIPLFGFAISLFNVSVLFWMESPFHLANKGDIEGCKRAHRWLKGTDEDTEKELAELIKTVGYKVTKVSFKDELSNFWKTASKRVFYKPLLLALLIETQANLTGKIVCTMYSIDIIRKITDSEHSAYIGMLILDGVTVFSMYVGCAITKVCKRRKLYFSFSGLGLSFLFIIATYLRLVKNSVLEENDVLTLSLLCLFSFSISSGPMVMASCLYGELLPVEYKNFSVTVVCLYFNVLNSTMIKIAPWLFKTFGLDIAFYFYGTAAGICTVLLWVFLPETKDKSMLEIRRCFDKDFDGKECRKRLSVNYID